LAAGRRFQRLWPGVRQGIALILRGRLDLLYDKVSRRWRGAALRRISAAELGERVVDSGPLTLFVDAGLGGGATEHARRAVHDLEQTGLTVVQLSVNGISGGGVVSSAALSLHHSISDADWRLFHDARLERVLAGVHVGTLVGFDRPLAMLRELASLVRRVSVPMTVYWHDHYLICPAHLLLDDSGRYCGVPSQERCNACIQVHPAAVESQVRSEGIAVWREVCGELLDAATTVSVFSDSSQDLIGRAYGSRFADRLSPGKHGMDYFHAARRVPTVESPVTIAVLGRISLHKGVRVVEQLAAEIKTQQADVSIAIVGSIDTTLDASVATVLGHYEVNELPDILEKLGVSLVFMPSVCPETFSYVVHEVMAMQLPLFTLPLGAQAEAARAYAHGGVASSLQPDSLLGEILEFAATISGGLAQGDSR
jgi:glycosyltransferase involved in cell wall biosynthesis